MGPAAHDAPLELWLLPAAELGLAELDCSGLSDEEQRRAGALRQARARRDYVAGRLLLRELVSERLGRDAAQIAYSREACPVCGGPNGRPVLADPGAAVQFSLARSAGLVLVGLAGTPVGVDIEAIPEAGVSEEVASLLHLREREELESVGPDGQAESFARLWVRKEAYLKARGTGLAHGLASEYVGLDPNAALPAGWLLFDVSVLPGYAAAAVLRTQPE